MVSAAFLRHVRRNHGVVTRREALDLGLSASTVSRLCRSGELVRQYAGVYRHAVVGDTWHSRLLAACLACGGVASHRAAARLHGIDGFESAPIEVSIAHGTHRPTRGAIVHKSRQFDLFRVIERNGIRCTPLPRTVLDVGAVVDPLRLRGAVENVIGSGRLRWSDLVSVLVIHSVQGRNGCGPLRQLLETENQTTRVARSVWSHMVADLLTASGLPRPQLEVQVVLGNGRKIFVDLAYPEAMIAIELDSKAWHDNPASFESDRARIRQLATLGWAPLPLTWQQYLNDSADFVAQVSSLLWSRSGSGVGFGSSANQM
ncbi:MAG: type IV toxin-antitoxin system AbiEi family antitoxin domain-containing protein [Acidimicrobiales bacterium]